MCKRNCGTKFASEQYIGRVVPNLAIYTFGAGTHCSVVPAYSAVYGGFAINMGDNRFPWDSRAVREDNDWVPQQRGMLAQQFVFGHVLGWMALEELTHWMTNATFAADIRFAGTLARLRMAAAKYLIFGSAYRPATVVAAPPTASIGTVSICDWGDAFSKGTPKCCNTSAVLATAWITTNGEIALAVANHGTTAATVELALQLQVDYMALHRDASEHTRVGKLWARPMARRQGEPDVAVTLDDDGRSRVMARIVKMLPGRTAAVLELQRN